MCQNFKNHASILLEDKELLQKKMDKIREQINFIHREILSGRIDMEEGFEEIQALHYDLDYLGEQVDQIQKDIRDFQNESGNQP